MKNIILVGYLVVEGYFLVGIKLFSEDIQMLILFVKPHLFLTVE